MGVVKKSIKCYFVTLNSILVFINSVFTLIIDIKIGYHFNNSIFFIKKYN